MKREKKYTKGEWKVLRYDYYGEVSCGENTGEKMKINVFTWDVRTKHIVEKEIANAHLISAAPDLLEALEEVIKAFNPDEQSLYDFARPVINKANKAIAKAYGDRK